ncbi:MAG: LuxR C-terminal-related transcriptional regulator [Oscillospiraceae bacterium]|nr:LuxR C-terminal-related transcriptional regulator [Oscillospiraceae bacterium]
MDMNATETDVYNAMFTNTQIARPRLEKIFNQAVNNRLVFVVAGAGYGKTRAVRQCIQNQEEAVVRWIQITESDNMVSRYWENYTHTVHSDNPELAEKLRNLGFPETLAQFKQFTGILKKYEHRSHKAFLVLDDFHLIHSESALTFAERCAHLNVPGSCVILISRTEPEINVTSLFPEERASIITESELRFTSEEIVEYLDKCGVNVSMRDVPKIANATKGWALAVSLLALVLKRTTGNLDYALKSMKQNVFNIMETEAWSDFSENTQKMLAGISLLSDLPVLPLRELFEKSSTLETTQQLSSFTWYDSFAGDYRIHPLYMEFLQHKRNILSNDERASMYKRAIQWCDKNNFQTGAMNYYAKLRDYEKMVKLFFSFPFKMPQDKSEYFLKILDGLNDDDKEDPALLLLKTEFVPLLLIGVGKYEEAKAYAEDVIEKWKNSKSPTAPFLMYSAYSNLACIDMYLCVVTHKYRAPEYMEKAIEYYKLVPASNHDESGPFFITHVRSFASLVGEGAEIEDFDRFLAASKETAARIAQTSHHMYHGYDDLVSCEIAYYKNELEVARAHANKTIFKAREKGQYSIAMVATGYLLRIATYEGDAIGAKKILQQLKDYTEIPQFWNAQLLYDLYTGLFYANIRLPELVPQWLSADDLNTVEETRIPVRELIVGAKSHIASKNYEWAITYLCNSYPRAPHERFAFGELSLTITLAVARFNAGDIEEAIKDFVRAYKLSYEGVFHMHFVESGKDICPLINEILKRKDNNIPVEWLKVTSRRAAVFSKKAAVIANAVRVKENVKEPVHLSAREQEILYDLYHGLSRDEIAAHRYLSINTVKKILQSIYIKLDANNNVDAVRIALEKKLVQ